jgi:N-acyl-L-homoserine lactone synthetase
MIRIVTKDNAGRYVSSLHQMFRIRKAVFKDRLGWNVTVIGEFEADEYDALGPNYVLSTDRRGAVNGCVRLLPTTGPNMLRDIFPWLVVDAAVPCGERAWEASRFAVIGNTTVGEAGLSQATYDLLIGVVGVALANGISTIACVVDVRMERILRRAGWPLERLGLARRIGNTIAIAGQLEVSERVLRQLEARASLAQVVAA